MVLRLIALLVLLGAVIPTGCEIDHGLEPNEGVLSGTVTYAGTAPANTETVQVIVFEKFMTREELIDSFLQGMLPTFYQSDPLPFDVAEAPYRISLPRGHYEWVTVIWVPKGQSLFNLVQLGTYEQPGNPGERGSVTVEARKELSGINIVASFDSVGTTSSFLATKSLSDSTKRRRSMEGRWPVR